MPPPYNGWGIKCYPVPSFRPSVISSFRQSVIPLSSVSVHYLSNGCTHSTQIWHMGMSWENTGWVSIWSWFDDFWQSYAPFTLKMIWNFSFRSLSAQRYYTFHSNLIYGYVMIKYRPSSNLVMVRWLLAEFYPFYFINNMKFSVSAHYPQRFYTLNLNLTFGYVKRIRRSSLNLVLVQWFLAELRPFHFENNMKF
jgi:hypothetical protein